jgi:hypothetical protein
VKWPVIVALAALAAGCLDSIEPDVGAPLRDLCVNDDSDPGTDVSFVADLRDGLFADNAGDCLTCHRPGGLGFEASGLSLATVMTTLTGGINSGSQIVVPGMPCDSIIVQKVSPAPPVGARMPLNRAPLTDPQAQLLRDWIAEGALDN